VVETPLVVPLAELLAGLLVATLEIPDDYW
jgi:hypothetical protein